MNSKFYERVSNLIWESLSGKGIYPLNRTVGALVTQLRIEFGLYQNDLTNEIATTIFTEGRFGRPPLIQRYTLGTSLGWFITNICYNYLRNKLKTERSYRRMMKKLHQDIDAELYDIPDYGNPEEIYLRKEKLLIINKHTTEDERDLLIDKLPLQEYAKKEKITLSAAKMRKKRLRDKLLKILHDAGYTSIL